MWAWFERFTAKYHLPQVMLCQLALMSWFLSLAETILHPRYTITVVNKILSMDFRFPCYGPRLTCVDLLIFWYILFLSWWWGSWTHYDHDSIISQELCTVLRFLLFSLLPSSTVRRAKRKGRDAVPWPDLLISHLCISHLLHLLVQYWMLYL